MLLRNRGVLIRIFSSLLLTGGLFAGFAVTAGPASAAQNEAQSFNVYWNFNAVHINRCIRFRVKGDITYTYGTAGRSWEWSNIKLNDPVLTAYVYPYNRCGSGSATTTSIEMAQEWTGYSCSFNPSVSVSVPWGIAFGGWPDCSNRNQAGDDTSYSDTSTNYLQGNSGDPADFPIYEEDNSPTAAPCYGVYTSGTGWVNNHSDSYDAANSSGAQRVCLSNGT